MLEFIGRGAFALAGNVESQVTFSNLKKLSQIGYESTTRITNEPNDPGKMHEDLPFLGFKGVAKLTGPFSSWTGAEVNKDRFKGSCINLGAPGTTVYETGQVPLTMAAVAAMAWPKNGDNGGDDGDDGDGGGCKGEGGGGGSKDDKEAKEAAKFTCIPSFEFMSHDQDLNLWPTPSLQSIGMMAFRLFEGTLTFPAGNLTKLSLIEAYAFDSMAVSSANSVVTIGAMPAVTRIEGFAFNAFKGKLLIDAGDMLALETIEQQAFKDINNDNNGNAKPGSSRITIGALPLIATLETEAFANAKVSKLVIDAGEVPHFSVLGAKAFAMPLVTRSHTAEKMKAFKYSVAFGEMELIETFTEYVHALLTLH